MLSQGSQHDGGAILWVSTHQVRVYLAVSDGLEHGHIAAQSSSEPCQSRAATALGLGPGLWICWHLHLQIRSGVGEVLCGTTLSGWSRIASGVTWYARQASCAWAVLGG